jgi:hypothetical protein
MADILCRRCSEPWDSYYLTHDIDADDGTPPGSTKRRIIAGEGCPACKWGKACPICGGSGIDRWYGGRNEGPCVRCDGTGKLDPTRDAPDDMEFLRAIEDSTDGMEIFDAIDGMMGG